MRYAGEESKRSDWREEGKNNREGKEGRRWRIKYEMACSMESEIECARSHQQLGYCIAEDNSCTVQSLSLCITPVKRDKVERVTHSS
jgi:hypothetical protein